MSFFRNITLLLALCTAIAKAEGCDTINCLVTQTVDKTGFHRLMRWLIEFDKNDVRFDTCILSLRQNIPAGAFVNPDEIADLTRVGKVAARVEGFVDVEQAMHNAEGHVAYVYSNITNERVELDLPIHLRYQRAQIGGDFGKVEFEYPWLLIRCKQKKNICGGRINAPYSHYKNAEGVWTNLTYKAISERVELVVPIGDLDHYPLVAIVTFLVTCSGCIYLLSVILSTPLDETPAKFKSS